MVVMAVGGNDGGGGCVEGVVVVDAVVLPREPAFNV